MTRDDIKKNRERLYLERARLVFDGFPSGPPQDGEAPDFLWETPSGWLGVEVVDYIRGLSSASVTMRTRDNLHSQVSDHARSKFEGEYGIPLMVHLHWNNSFKLNRRQTNALGADLAAVVAENIPGTLYRNIVVDYQTSSGHIFDAIHRVSITRLRDGAAGLWAAIEAGFIGGAATDIQALVEQKDAKVEQYLRRCSEVWLLIVADGRHISSSLEISDVEALITTRFTRVLLYDGSTHTVTPLK